MSQNFSPVVADLQPRFLLQSAFWYLGDSIHVLSGVRFCRNFVTGEITGVTVLEHLGGGVVKLKSVSDLDITVHARLLLQNTSIIIIRVHFHVTFKRPLRGLGHRVSRAYFNELQAPKSKTAVLMGSIACFAEFLGLNLLTFEKTIMGIVLDPGHQAFKRMGSRAPATSPSLFRGLI